MPGPSSAMISACACTWDNLQLIFTRNYWWPTFESDLYRPLTTLSFLFNYSVLRNANNPDGYHVLNMILHGINALLVYRLVRTQLKHRGAALVVAAIWTVHPLNTEVVTNIAGRADLLAALSLLLAVNLHIQPTSPQWWRQLLRRGAIFLITSAGVFCKENAIMAIPLMLLIDLFHSDAQDVPWRRGGLRPWLRRVDWIDYLVALPGMVTLLALRYWVGISTPVFAQSGADNPIALAGFWTGRMTAIKVLGYYLSLAVWPAWFV